MHGFIKGRDEREEKSSLQTRAFFQEHYIWHSFTSPLFSGSRENDKVLSGPSSSKKQKKKHTNKNSSFTHTLKLLLPLIQGLKSIHIFPWMPRIIFQTLRFCFADLCYHFIGKHYTVNYHVITKKKKHLNVELYIYLCHDVIHCTINKRIEVRFLWCHRSKK